MPVPDKALRLGCHDADSEPEIIAAVARIQFRRCNPGADCPDDEIPDPAALAAWLERCPADALDEANRILRRLIGDMEYPDSARWAVATIRDWSTNFGLGTGVPPNSPRSRLMAAHSDSDPVALSTIETIHRVWRAQEDARPASARRAPHPLDPLLRAWQQRPCKVEADTLETAIMPDPLFAWAGGAGRSPAPAILTLPRHDNELPINLGPGEPDPMLYLPGFEPPESEIVQAPALVMVDEAGFGALTGGSGARLDKRLFVYSLLAVPYSERRPGGRYELRPKLRELVHTLLWPAPCSTGTGKGDRSTWKPSRHGSTLHRAMNAVTLAGVQLPDGRTSRPVMFRTLPDFNDLDSVAEIEIKLPDIAGHGPRVHRGNLIAAGVTSDPAYNAWLTLATFWDRMKASNGGRRIYATRPKALRDPQGRLRRADGSPILGHPQNPIRGKNRRAEWKPGNAPQGNWRHPEAVIVGEERNPAADRVPLLDRNDRRRLFYGHASATLSKSGRSEAADRAENCLRKWERLGRVVIECERGGWRILEPRPLSPVRGDA